MIGCMYDSLLRVLYVVLLGLAVGHEAGDVLEGLHCFVAEI